MVKKNTCIFISGRGSNLKNLIKRTRDYNFPIKIKLIICNNKKCVRNYFCKKNFIPYLIIDTKIRTFENQILSLIKKHKISLICLAGYMKIISKDFLEIMVKKLLISTLHFFQNLKD